jgi:hypothetical protein
MTDINLITHSEENKMLGTGTSLLFAVLLFVAFIYVALFFYGNKLDSDMDQLKAEYSSKAKSFIAGDGKKALDFQNRLLISDELLAGERNSNKDIGKIEEAMIVGVYLGSYKYDDATKSITLDCFADNYETVAKQILSFKSYDYFSSVLAGETKFDVKNNKINFPVVLTIK